MRLHTTPTDLTQNYTQLSIFLLKFSAKEHMCSVGDACDARYQQKGYEWMMLNLKSNLTQEK